MLLNASHELTNCGLPQHIQDRYVRYKQGNRAIVAWMTRYGPDKYKGRKTLPIKQLVALGKLLCEKTHEIGTLPSDVDYYFKEVIRERAYLSQHFREFRDQCERDEIDTINHEHFTESLKQIHKILLTAGRPPMVPKSMIPKKYHPHSRASTNSSSGIINSFAHLSTVPSQSFPESDESDGQSLSDTDTNDTSECSHSITDNQECLCEDGDEDTDFLDTQGAIGIAVETTMFIENIIKISETIKSYWIKSGQGDIPVAAAAAYTNVLLAKAVICVKDFSQPIGDQTGVLDIRERVGRLFCDTDHHSHVSDHDLSDIAKTLSNVHDELRRTAIDRSSHKEKASPYIEYTANPASLVDALISGLHHAYECRMASLITFDGIPRPTDLFTTGGGFGHNPDMFAAAVIVYLMSVSHCAYSSTLVQPSHIALPRISALKMANEALGVVGKFINDKSIFPCQCVNTLAYRISQMSLDLRAFAKYKCWNIVSQSPLVAGNHVLEIHDICSYYGMHLFHYRQYVAGVLHPYQTLVKLNAIQPIPLLEEVCDMFASVLYTTGTRPDSGFLASWLRYIGARLKFKKGKKNQNHKDTWCMAVPAHAAAKSAGLNIGQRNEDVTIQPKFDYGTIDQIIGLKRNGWILTEDTDAILFEELRIGSSNHGRRLSTSQPGQPQSKSFKAKRTKHTRTKSCLINNDKSTASEDCSRLDHTLMANLTVDASGAWKLPPSRLNLLSLFYSMTQIVSGVSDATHADDNKGSTTSENDGRGQMCLCFVQTILRGADRILDVRRRNGLDANGAMWTKNEKECIECYKKSLMKVLDEAKILDGDSSVWLWSSV